MPDFRDSMRYLAAHSAREYDIRKGIPLRSHELKVVVKGWWIFKRYLFVCRWCGEKDPVYPCYVTDPLHRLATTARED